MIMDRGIFPDKNGFLTIGQYETDELLAEWKEYTRSFYKRPYTDFDHTVLLFDKWNIVEKQWKDIWSTQQILRYRPQYVFSLDKPDQRVLQAWFNILYIQEDIGDIKIFSKVDKNIEEYVYTNTFDKNNTKNTYEHMDEYLSDKNIMSFLFWLLLAHWSWTIKEWVLYPVKLTLPLSSSLFGKKDLVENIFTRLDAFKLAHSYSFHQSSTFEYCQAIFYDPILLKQWQKWLKDTFPIEKNSGSDYIQKVYEVLKEYSCERGACLDWKYDMLQMLPCD